MNLTSRQDLFDVINAAKHDKQQLWAAIAPITREFVRLQAVEVQFKALVDEGSDALTEDLTEDELRAHVKSLLITRLKDKTLTAAEIAQFKDVFGLANKSSDIEINVVNYAGICDGCDRLAMKTAKEQG